ncbi:MAG TPA: Ig-like domain-containing protein, partial [Ktedonobacteraceae bacterium]|nr:Ig-like domain-containing protein [Ktedonobacteraceae bacterium]
MLVNQGRRRQRLVSGIGICTVLIVLALLSVTAPVTHAASRAPTDAPRPVVSFTSPGQFATFSPGAPIQIVVAASISSGSITHVDFQAEPNSGTNPNIILGSDTTA